MDIEKVNHCAQLILNHEMRPKDNHFYHDLNNSEKKELFNQILNVNTPYHKIYAIFEGNSRLLITFMKDVAQIIGSSFVDNSCAKTILHYSIMGQNSKITQEKILKLYIENGLNPNTYLDGNLPLLHLVATQNQMQLIDYLIKKGANINVIDYEDDSLLTSTIAQKENVEPFNYVLNLNKVNFFKGKNILACAVNARYSKIIQIILDHPISKDNNFLEKARKEVDEPIELEQYLINHEKQTLNQALDKIPKTNTKMKI